MYVHTIGINIDKETITARQLATIKANGVYKLYGTRLVREDTKNVTNVPFLEAKTCFLNQFLKTNKIKAL